MSAPAPIVFSLTDLAEVYADERAEPLVRKLKDCGDDLEREREISLQLQRAFMQGVLTLRDALRESRERYAEPRDMDPH